MSLHPLVDSHPLLPSPLRVYLPSSAPEAAVGTVDAYLPERLAPVGRGDASASPATGELAARATIDLDRPSRIERACASLSVGFGPDAGSTRVRFSAEVHAEASIGFLIERGGVVPRERVDYLAQVILTGWEIDPARGSWRRFRRSVRHAVLDSTTATDSARFDGIVHLDRLARRGRRYTFQAAIQVGIACGTTAAGDRVRRHPAHGDAPPLRIALVGTIPRMSIELLEPVRR